MRCDVMHSPEDISLLLQVKAVRRAEKTRAGGAFQVRSMARLFHGLSVFGKPSMLRS